MQARELSIGAVPCLAVQSAPTSASSAGSCTARPSSVGGSGTRSGLRVPQPRPRRRWVQGDRLAAAREGLPRKGLGHHPGAVRTHFGGCKLEGEILRGGMRWQERPEPEQELCCLTLDDPRSVALGSTPFRVGETGSSPRPRAALRLLGRALRRARRTPSRSSARSKVRWRAGPFHRRSRCAPSRPRARAGPAAAGGERMRTTLGVFRRRPGRRGHEHGAALEVRRRDVIPSAAV